MRKALSTSFSVVTILLVATVVLQLYLAGVGVFSNPSRGLFSIHGMTGRIVLPILILLTLVFAAVTRAGKRTVWLSVLLIGLLIMQTLIFIITGAIFNVGPETPDPPLGATLMVSLHPVNGLAILWVSVVVARRAWRMAFGAGARDGAGTRDEAGLPAAFEAKSVDAAAVTERARSTTP